MSKKATLVPTDEYGLWLEPFMGTRTARKLLAAFEAHGWRHNGKTWGIKGSMYTYKRYYLRGETEIVQICLDDNGQNANGALLYQQSCGNTTNQTFAISDDGAGHFKIMLRATGAYLSIGSGGGLELDGWNANGLGADRQTWKIRAVDDRHEHRCRAQRGARRRHARVEVVVAAGRLPEGRRFLRIGSAAEPSAARAPELQKPADHPVGS